MYERERPGAARPAFSNVTYSGFVNGDTPSSLSGTLGCTTTASSSSPATAYPITCSGLSSPNYLISLVSCAGSMNPSGMPAGTYTVTVSGTSNSTVHTTTLTLIVQ